MKRPHITKKYSRFVGRATTFAEYFKTRATLANPRSVPRIVPDDAKDDAILACAKKGKAQYIVSGDEHLLKLRVYEGIKILTPREFVEQVLDPQ